jgi:signal transduction histidine kinase
MKSLVIAPDKVSYIRFRNPSCDKAQRTVGRTPVAACKRWEDRIVASRQALKADGQAILEINREITAELQAEDALRNAEKFAAMGRMAGTIAHEINNPLEAITNTFFLLRNHPSLDEEARHYARLAEQEASGTYLKGKL